VFKYCGIYSAIICECILLYVKVTFQLAMANYINDIHTGF